MTRTLSLMAELNEIDTYITIWHAGVIYKIVCWPKGPQSDISMIGGGGGGPTEVHISYPKNAQLQNLSTQKNPTFLSIPQEILHQQ